MVVGIGVETGRDGKAGIIFLAKNFFSILPVPCLDSK